VNRPLVHTLQTHHRRPLRQHSGSNFTTKPYLSWKITSATRYSATGLPACVAGLNFQRLFTIVQAASSSRDLPLGVVTAHSLTVPSSFTRYLIETLPCSCRRMDTGG